MSTFRAEVSLHFVIGISMMMLSCSEGGDDRSSPLTEKRTLDQTSTISTEWRSSTSDETLQKHLSSLGYDPGTIDGVMGPKTRAAIMRFQRDRQLLPSGRVGPATTAYLMPASVQQVGTFLSRSEIKSELFAHSSGYSYSGYLSPLREDAGGYNLLSSYPSHLDPNIFERGGAGAAEYRRRWR